MIPNRLKPSVLCHLSSLGMTMKGLLCASATFALLLPACTPTGSDGGERTSALIEESKASADSANSVAIFEDADGRLDSIFSSRGFVYGSDIVKAAKSGNADAAFILAQMYAYGVAGAKPDRAKAFRLFVNLADNGNIEAKANAGYMMLYGCGVESDPAKGLDMLMEAANNDCATAYLFLGRFYADAEPTPENKRNAKLCFAQARDLGIPEADVLLKSIN